MNMGVDIEKKMNGLIQKEDGKLMSDKEAREFLAECQNKGWKLLPSGDVRDTK